MFKKLKRFSTIAAAVTLGLGGLVADCAAQAPGNPVVLKATPATLTAAATKAGMLGAAMAGGRIVAVGDYGTIILSDDQGKTFHQAKSVPVSSTLTSVSFVDAKEGWAAGHWGAILHTADGGDTWQMQRLDTSEDRPLFAVHFFDKQQGIAVGLWSLVLATSDGGAHWNPVTIPAPPEGGRADRNLFGVFASPKGSLFVAAERGTVLRTDDRGQTWRYINTGYKGSFWTGLALDDGVLLVAGLRGTIYRSTDDGETWSAVVSGTKSSITDLIEQDGKVLGVALDGVQIDSTDHGASFTATQRDDRLSMTALAPAGTASVVRFSKAGVVHDQKGPADDATLKAKP